MSKPYKHALSSAKKYGGKYTDYLSIHTLLDSSKMIIGDNRHRVFTHNAWFISDILPKIYDETFERGSDFQIISTRDIGEQHVLEDFGRFIPSLKDYYDDINFSKLMNEIHINEILEFLENSNFNYIKNILKLPKKVVNNSTYVLMTCNTWFIYNILPKINYINYYYLDDFLLGAEQFGIQWLNPTIIANSIEFKDWMQNGLGVPPTYASVINTRRKIVID